MQSYWCKYLYYMAVNFITWEKIIFRCNNKRKKTIRLKSTHRFSLGNTSCSTLLCNVWEFPLRGIKSRARMKIKHIFQFPAVSHKLFKTNMFQPREKTVVAPHSRWSLSILIYCGKRLQNSMQPVSQRIVVAQNYIFVKTALKRFSPILPVFPRDLCVNRWIDSRSPCDEYRFPSGPKQVATRFVRTLKRLDGRETLARDATNF